MPKKNNRQKKGLAKRLWHSITEPIPDENDDQANEQIPLAYDLKDPDSSQDDNQASGQADATSTASQAPVSQVTNSTTSETSDSATQPTRRSRLSATAATSSASSQEQPMVDVTSATSQASAPSSASWRHVPESATSAATSNGQPVISVTATEAKSADDEPQIPLSREELFEDQQPNAGSASSAASEAPMSRLARHNESETETASEPTENPHLKKKVKPSKPHQKPKSHRSGKLVAAGVGILIVAALGFIFMWTHAKTTQAQAKANAEAIVQEVYTSDAQRDLQGSASSDKLAQLQTYIDEMAKSDEKTSLQKQHDLAVKMLKLRSAYDDLYTGKHLIKTAVTTKTVKAAQTQIKTSGLMTKKAYFTKKYTTKLAATNKIVKKVQGYHKDFNDLYTKKDKLKSSVSTTDVDSVLKHMKAYRTKSQLAADDYTTLKSDRKALAKAESSAAASSASAYSAAMDSSSAESAAESSSIEASSSSDDATTSSSDDTTSSTGTTGSTGNDNTTTSSAKHSSSTTTSNDNSQTTGTGTGTSDNNSTTTGNDTTGTTSDTTTTTTN